MGLVASDECVVADSVVAVVVVQDDSDLEDTLDLDSVMVDTNNFIYSTKKSTRK